MENQKELSLSLFQEATANIQENKKEKLFIHEAGAQLQTNYTTCCGGCMTKYTNMGLMCKD